MSANALRAAIEHLLVDAPTEAGDWCIVDDERIYSPTEVEISTWTEIVDEDDDRVDEDDPIAVANGHEVTRVTVSVYYAGSEERRALPRDRRWVRFEAFMDVVEAQAADLARLRAAVREIRDAEAANLIAFDGEIKSGEALPMTDESLAALKSRMKPYIDRIEAARAALDALTREP
jgi:hypothetical protein